MDQSPAKRRPTIRDVAAKAGVSRGTVSRVINGGHWVSPDALAKVESAIAETGYSANQAARSLASGRANSVAFLLTEPQHLLFEDPTFSILLRGAAQSLAKRGMPLVLMIAGTAEERRQIMAYLSAGHVDGVLLVSSHAGNTIVDSLIHEGIPTIACGRPIGFESKLGYVAADDLDGARQMTRHLVECGYKNIAMIAGPRDTPGGQERVRGYLDVVGQDREESYVAYGDYSRASGQAAMAELLTRGMPLDAVFVASDLMASGAMTALREAGLSIPGDVAVAGFDDSGLAATLDPPLTTMHQPFDRIAEEMVRILLDVVGGELPAAVTLPTTLVQRASTAVPDRMK